MTREEAIARLRAVVDADDEIAQLKRARDARFRVLPWTWRWAYAARERADREAWGTCADDRARFARELLAVLEEGEHPPRRPTAPSATPTRP